MRAPYILCKGFLAQGWKVEAITPAGPQNEGVATLWGQVPVRRVAGRGDKFRYLSVGLRLLGRRRERIVLSWVWDWHCFFLVLGKILFGNRYAIVMDTFTFKASPRRRERLWEELRYGLVLRNADVIFAETPQCLEHARRHLRRPDCLLVPSCFWEAEFRAREARWEAEGYDPARRPVILYAGRIIPRKNLQDLITAFGRVCAAFPEWTVEIRGPVTDGAYHESLKGLVASLGLEGRILFLPAVYGEDLFKLYRETSVWALPSEGEGFPSAVLEAMYFAGAIIAAPSGYVSYQLGDGDCCIYHDPRDVDALARGLQALMGSEPLREQYRTNARRRMREKFTWERYFPLIERKFRALLPAGDPGD